MSTNSSNLETDSIPLCDKHHTPMLPSKRDKGFWYCPQKEDDGSYCKFKVAPSTKRASQSFNGPIMDMAKIRDERIGVAGLLQAKIAAKLVKEINDDVIIKTLEETRLIKKIVEDNQ